VPCKSELFASPDLPDPQSKTQNLPPRPSGTHRAAPPFYHCDGAGLGFSYLFVLLYLPIAVGSVMHLFLENPVKLPFLNVGLPLVGFFGLRG